MFDPRIVERYMERFFESIDQLRLQVARLAWAQEAMVRSTMVSGSFSKNPCSACGSQVMEAGATKCMACGYDKPKEPAHGGC